MPIYEFYCSKCKEVFEELVSSREKIEVPCPVCRQSQHTQKCMSAASIGKCLPDNRRYENRAACSPGAFS